ncbi:hypothetical protein HG536_0D02550 [Torulaspora globosa]|uniref:Secreted protein n=1 Tax=Torulaspora globosa TaxID=48254 RepID=A0A7G3ZGU7_9SACH|nr:uncharacterized protein HG536_0D02550 [Torulaspora globosa]QLL32733.1 hypothetical protein HG536_0D02550 [Torulaspora globosa]
MSHIGLLKVASALLFLALICNLAQKLFERYIAFYLRQWLMNCSGGECNNLRWWQRFPPLEKLVWSFLDSTEGED